MEEQFIGNYKIIEKIGAGGMAKVYLAVHKDVPSLKVVLKVLTDPRLAERFRQEADKLALLDANPNICRIKHFFNHGEDFIIAMDYIDGQTLREKLDVEKRINISDALKITSDVLAILADAHEIDIYHRDIKPSNVMITSRDVVKVIDFGIAKGKADPDLTIAGTSAGTPAYMAPEQFTPDDSIDYAKVDIYAVGTTLYRLLAGEMPFKADNEFAMRDAKLFEEPIKPSKLNSEISSELDKIIMKAISKEAENRFDSVTEMKRVIDDLYRKSIDIATSDTKDVATLKPSKKPPSSKRSKMPAILGAITLIAIAYLLYWVVGKDKDTEESDIAPPIDTNVVVSTDSVITEEIILTGSFVVSLIPSGNLFINDELFASNISDSVIALDTGTYSIRAVNDSAINSPITDNISLAPDEILPRTYTFEFAKIETKPVETKPIIAKVDSGQIRVACREGSANVFVDGNLMSDHTPNTIKIPVGYHEIRIEPEIDGKPVPYTEKINLTKDQILIIKWKNQSD